jgi:deoxyribonuclease-4
MQKLLYGAHMSIAGGLDKAITTGQSIGCTSIQLFTKSNRQWTATKLTEQEITDFKKATQYSGIDPIVAHTSYLINIGSPKKDIAAKSIESLITELDRCNKLSIPYLVFHPGAHLNTDEQYCLEKIIENINGILESYSDRTMLLLELMAGQGSTVCYSFEQLAYIYKHVKNKKSIGICFDTAHAWAAGYDFSTFDKYMTMWQQFDNIIGIENLKVIHMNDSKAPWKSYIDRHETIGKGTIGLETFKFFMNDERLFDIPKILETPKESLEDDVYNMNILRNLISPSTLKKLHIKI